MTKKIIGIFFLMGIVTGLWQAAWLSNSFAAKGQVLTSEQIITGAKDYLLDRLPWDKNSTELSIHYSGGELELPKGNLEVDYRVNEKTLRPGRIPMVLTLKVDRKFQRRVRIAAFLTVVQDVVKTLRPLRRGDMIGAEDVRVERVSAKRDTRRWATRLEDVVGYEAKRSIKVDQKVSLDALKKPPMIKKGDRVILLVERGVLKITAPGKAMEKGFEGGMIKVTNTQTKKKVYGRVIDQSTVEVLF